MAPKLTVIIASYNHADYLGAAIRSVLAQTFTDFELLIADDGSTDNSCEIVAGFDDPRIRLIRHEKNLGLCRNINLAFAQARGTYIAQMGSDDIFLPEKLARQVEVLDHQPNVAVVITHCAYINHQGRVYYRPKYEKQPIHKTRHEWLDVFFSVNSVPAPSTLMRREAMDKIGLYDERLKICHDYDWWVRFCLAGYDLHVIPQVLTHYRRLPWGKTLSAYGMASYNLSMFERRKVMQRYLSIKDTAEIEKIFGIRLDDPIEALIPYYIACEALKKGTRVHHEFAIETLYHVLENTETIDLLKQKYGFTPQDYYRLTLRNALSYPMSLKEIAIRVLAPLRVYRMPVRLSCYDVIARYRQWAKKGGTYDNKGNHT